MAEKTMSREELLKDIEVQNALAEAELKKVQLEEARASLQEKKESLQERESRRQARINQCRQQARQLQEEDELRRARVLTCPHKKGGTDYEGWKRGTSEHYSVIRHQWPNGDYDTKCTRCKNIVIPPVEPLRVPEAEEVSWLADFGYKRMEDAGYFLKTDKEGYARAMKEYRVGLKEYTEWLGMPTNNITSTSCLPTQTSGRGDWKRLYRLALHESLGIPIFAAQKYHTREASNAA